MKPKKIKAPRDQKPRFGIGEWYGHRLTELTSEQRRYYALESLRPKKERQPQPCPFKARKDGALCTKDGGVCSIKTYAYKAHDVNGRATGEVLNGKAGELRATCPHRFNEELEIFRWVGEVILNDERPKLVGEVGFLEASATTDNEGGDDVGRIDMVLVSTKTQEDAPLEWAALEIQAVYFSGQSMTSEFRAFSDENVDWVIYPAGSRRPDYRSCGPKRLMPQLQIKVPTLRRWGKKMAVVVDRAFFDSIGEMDHVSDISNADIAWFIVKFEETNGVSKARLIRDEVRYTTLERAVDGLTGGKPVPLSTFEQRILKKPSLPQAENIDSFDLLSNIIDNDQAEES